MDKAIDAYWQDRIYIVLNQIGSRISDEIIFKLWKELLDDMYREDDTKNNIYNKFYPKLSTSSAV